MSSTQFHLINPTKQESRSSSNQKHGNVSNDAKRKLTSSKPPLWKVWLVAARPHTLTASVSPVLVGYYATQLAAGDSTNDGIDERVQLRWLALQWLMFCMLMQLGTNLHNDYSDFVQGADTEKRVGQARATQRGWLTPFQTAFAATSILFLGFMIGSSFIYQIAIKNDYEQEDNNPYISWKIYFMLFILFSCFMNRF